MKQRLQALLAKGDALSPRERLILFVLLLAAVWALLDTALMSPLQRARQAEAVRIQAAQERLQRAQEALAQVEGRVPPDVAAVRRLESERAAFNSRMQAAQRLQGHLVAPKDMAALLRGLTRSQPGLRLLSLHTLTPQAVGGSAPATAANPNAQPKSPAAEAALYKHGVTLTLSGSYAALVNYMRAVERLPVGFFWASAELDASRHPDIELTLTLNTLSLERPWLTL
jgi:MSHA biogenesis protein MshJ